MDALLGVDVTEWGQGCSTPFGDIDGCTNEDRAQWRNIWWCSTPFGDIDGCTQAVQDAIDAQAACSTPFGDIDGCTWRVSLSIIRDYGCSTPFGDIDGCTPHGQQEFPYVSRAQRLSATLMDALLIGFSLLEPCFVLNAFRRH